MTEVITRIFNLLFLGIYFPGVIIAIFFFYGRIFLSAERLRQTGRFADQINYAIIPVFIWSIILTKWTARQLRKQHES